MDFLAITRRSCCFKPITIEIIGSICAARVILANPILLWCSLPSSWYAQFLGVLWMLWVFVFVEFWVASFGGGPIYRIQLNEGKRGKYCRVAACQASSVEWRNVFNTSKALKSEERHDDVTVWAEGWELDINYLTSLDCNCMWKICALWKDLLHMQQFCHSGKKFQEDCKDQSLVVIILGFGGLFPILWFEWAPKPFRIFIRSKSICLPKNYYRLWPLNWIISRSTDVIWVMWPRCALLRSWDIKFQHEFESQLLTS